MVWRMVIYGFLLTLITLFMPDGIFPSVTQFWKRKVKQFKSLHRYQPQAQQVSADSPIALVEIPVHDTGSFRLREVRKANDQTKGKDGSLQDRLSTIKNLCVFFGGVRAVDDVSFSIKSGEILSIIGPNGAGKTTILNAITHFGPITSGDILHNDQSLVTLSPHEIARRGIVRTFQHTNVFPGITTKGNLILGHNSLEPEGLLENIVKTKRCRHAKRKWKRELKRF